MAYCLTILLLACFVVGNVWQSNADQIFNITLLEGAATADGAVCLDGSPPAYFHASGFGDGAANWVVYLEGGGWCAKEYCNIWINQRTTHNITKPKHVVLMLDSNKTNNPDFYNWNRIYVVYCDGASFSGDVESDPQYYNIKRRGARIFSAVMEDLLAKGMKNAKNAILMGSSAGGLATILNCDRFAALIPNASRLKCIADAGFFIRGKSDILPADDRRAAAFDSIILFHNLTNFLPKSCTSKMHPSQCMFPENFVNNITTPLFLLQSTMDTYQVEYGLTHDLVPNDTWSMCTEITLQNCTDYQINFFKEFRSVFLKTLQGLGSPPPSRGMYIHSCIIHGHLSVWNISDISKVEAVPKALGGWYYDRKSIQAIDNRDDVKPVHCTLNNKVDM